MVDGPPRTLIFLRTPSTTNRSHSPSAENSAPSHAPSVPAIDATVLELRSRTISRGVPPLSRAVCTIFRPSAEMAMYGRSQPGRPIVVENRIGCGTSGRVVQPRPIHPAAAEITAIATSTAAIGATRLRAGAGRRPVRVTVGSRAASAAANSAVLAKRSAGSLSSAVKIAASTASGTLRRRETIGDGSSVITLATIDCAVGPVKGGSPSSISYVVAPREYTSLRAVISRSPIACSGLM